MAIDLLARARGSQTTMGDSPIDIRWPGSGYDWTSSGIDRTVAPMPDTDLLDIWTTLAGREPPYRARTTAQSFGQDWWRWLANRMPFLTAGTGGFVTIARSSLRPASSLVAPRDVIANLRSALSLNMSEVARVLRVERPTVYAWLRSDSVPQRSNSIRLARLNDVARRWQRGMTAPLGDAVRTAGTDGRSLVDLLATDPLPEEHIEQRLAEAVRDVMDAARPRIPPVRDAARRRGISPGGRGPHSEVDFLTGRPFGPEDE
jgi:hypothetical protein